MVVMTLTDLGNHEIKRSKNCKSYVYLFHSLVSTHKGYTHKAFENYDVILGNPFFVNQRRTMKFIKKGIKVILKNPSLLFDQKKRTIKFHFDIMHGENNLQKAINLLDDENRKDFTNYVNSKQYFYPFNMFICKSKELLEKYYGDLFPWLERCETVFSSKKLEGYDLARIYAFLAERFTSYWFEKNAKYKTMNITFCDIRKNIN